MSVQAVIVAYGLNDIEQVIDRFQRRGDLEERALVVGIARVPSAKCWRVGVSRDSAGLTWVSAHRRKQEAEQQISQVYRALSCGDIADDQVFASLMQQLQERSDAALDAACEGAGRRVLDQFRVAALQRAGMEELAPPDETS